MGIAYKSKCLDYTVYGKSEQETRSGKNLFSQAIYDTTSSGIKFTTNTDNSITLEGTLTGILRLERDLSEPAVLQPGIYTLSITNPLNAPGTFYIKSNSAEIVSMYIASATSRTFNITEETLATKVGLYLSGVGESYNTTIYPQLESGSKATPYEQYGASPSPDYPSEIKTIPSMFNECNITDLKSYTSDAGYPKALSGVIKINKFDSNNIDFSIVENLYGMVLSNNIQLKKNTKYTISYNRLNENYTANRFYLYNVNKDNAFRINIQSYDTINGKYTGEFTTDSNGTIAISFGSDNTSSGGHSIISDIYIYEGTIERPYVPYGYYLRIDDVGKNLFNDNNYKNFTYNKSNDAINLIIGEHSFTFTGTKQYSGFYLTNLQNFIDGYDVTKTYYISFDIDSGIDGEFRCGMTKQITLPIIKGKQRLKLTSHGNLMAFYSMSDTNATYTISKIMFSENDDDVYEPYRSPKTYFIDLAKNNLANIDDMQIGKTWYGDNLPTYACIIGIVLKPGTTYTFQGDISSNTNLALIRVVTYNSSSIGTPTGTANNNSTFTTSATTDRCSVEIRANTNITSDMLKDVSIKLYEGPTTEDHYELCSTKDLSVRDKLIIENGYARVEKKIYEAILNGTENWKMTVPSATNYHLFWNTFTAFGLPNGEYGEKLCDRFEYEKKDWRDCTPNHLAENDLENLSLLFNVDFCTTVEEWKRWLSKNNLVVQYKLETPYTADLGQVDFPIIDGEIKGIAYNGKEVKGIAYGGKVIFTAQD